MEGHHSMPISKADKMDNLFRLLSSVDTPEACKELLSDLCTMKELENMAERLHAAKLLMAGNTYNQIMSQAEISSATLSRVSRCVQYGKGYSQLLK